jgi:hypothetical protein
MGFSAIASCFISLGLACYQQGEGDDSWRNEHYLKSRPELKIYLMEGDFCVHP